MSAQFDFNLLSLNSLCHTAIDDKLPVTADDRPRIACTRSREQLWPALVEKAVRSPSPSVTVFPLSFRKQYLTVMGGYDFAGSCVTLSPSHPLVLTRCEEQELGERFIVCLLLPSHLRSSSHGLHSALTGWIPEYISLR